MLLEALHETRLHCIQSLTLSSMTGRIPHKARNSHLWFILGDNDKSPRSDILVTEVYSWKGEAYAKLSACCAIGAVLHTKLDGKHKILESF